MRSVQLTASKDVMRPAMNYIQVKNGFVYATNSFALVKVPVKEVFGVDAIDEPLIATDEELYFQAALWATAKMNKAFTIKREGLLFEAVDKSYKTIGQIQAISAADFYNKLGGKFPDIEVVIPETDKPTKELSQIAFDPDLMLQTCKSFDSGDKDVFQFTFYGFDKAIIIKSSKSEALGLVMPILFPDEETTN